MVDGAEDGVVDGAAAGLAEVGVGAAIMAGLVQAGAVAGAAGIRVVAVGEFGNMTKAPAILSAGVSGDALWHAMSVLRLLIPQSQTCSCSA